MNLRENYSKDLRSIYSAVTLNKGVVPVHIVQGINNLTPVLINGKEKNILSRLENLKIVGYID